MQIVQNYANGVSRTIDVTSVDATDDADTVIVNTAASGQMVVCRLDQVNMWQQLVDLGLIGA